MLAPAWESFGYDHEWNYFRLETEELEPSGVYDDEIDEESYNTKEGKEDVTEIYPGQYEAYGFLESSRYREQEDYEYDRPKEMRHVTRWFRGSFVIFCKRSLYNRTSSTYDGRHNKMTTDEFREYIQGVIDYLKQK